MAKRKCPTCKMQRRVGTTLVPSSFIFSFLASLDNLSGISVRILRAIVFARAHDLYFLQFFSFKPFFTPRARAGFIELIPKITPYNLPDRMERRKISYGLFYRSFKSSAINIFLCFNISQKYLFIES